MDLVQRRCTFLISSIINFSFVSLECEPLVKGGSREDVAKEGIDSFIFLVDLAYISPHASPSPEEILRRMVPRADLTKQPRTPYLRSPFYNNYLVTSMWNIEKASWPIKCGCSFRMRQHWQNNCGLNGTTHRNSFKNVHFWWTFLNVPLKLS